MHAYFFKKPTGGVIEIFCLTPHSQYPDITTAMSQQQKVLWHCLIGGASKWKAGQVLEKEIGNGGDKLFARYLEKANDTFVIVEISLILNCSFDDRKDRRCACDRIFVAAFIYWDPLVQVDQKSIFKGLPSSINAD